MSMIHLVDFSSTDNKESYENRKLNGVVSTTLRETHSDSKRAAILYGAKFYKCRCIYCGKKLGKVHENILGLNNEASMEHIVPASFWGLFVKGNIALACKDCNNMRGNTNIYEFYSDLIKTNHKTLFPSLKAFKKSLDKFQLPYKETYPQIFALNNEIINDPSILDTENISINISYKKSNITNVVTAPLRVNNSSYQKKNITTCNMIKEEQKKSPIELFLNSLKVGPANLDYIQTDYISPLINRLNELKDEQIQNVDFNSQDFKNLIIDKMGVSNKKNVRSISIVLKLIVKQLKSMGLNHLSDLFECPNSVYNRMYSNIVSENESISIKRLIRIFIILKFLSLNEQNGDD